MGDVLASVRLTFKLHRFELGAALAVGLALAAWAAAIALRSDASSIPSACLEAWARVGPEAEPACVGAMHAWGATIVNESPQLLAVLAYVPFAIGVLAGVPIVAHELETGTARTAWSLYPSRATWLGRQALPPFVAIVAILGLAGVASQAVEADRVIWGYSAVEDLGRYGLPIVANAAMAYTIGLGVGALVGRSLPALVLATALIVAFSGASAQAHEAWLRGLQPTVISEGSGSEARELSPRATLTGIAWRSPDGRQLSVAEAATEAAAAGVADAATNDAAAGEWLETHGYVPLGLGVSEATALSWGTIQAAGTAVTAAAFALLAFFSVGRRRPR